MVSLQHNSHNSQGVGGNVAEMLGGKCSAILATQNQFCIAIVASHRL